ANIMFQLQLAFAVMETPPEIDLDKVIDRIPQVMDLDDFLAYWIDFIAPEVTDQELRTLLNYLQSDIYREANEVLDKIDP
ncbi:MAG: hypothetical protein GWN86_26020, partial [Desulfobacterales bacterium]|nr:hypothetical protein [Desulfobacterales bacterium]